MVHDSTNANAVGNTMVSFDLPPSRSLRPTYLTDESQAFPVRGDRLFTCPRLPPDDSYPRRPTTSDTWHHPARIFYTFRALAHATDRDINPTLRPCRKRQWKLSDVCTETGIYRCECGDITILDTDQYMQLLEGSICVRGGRNGVLPLYDGAGMAGSAGRL